MKPLAIDLFCGLGGWTEGLLAEGYEVIGFDITRHQYGKHRYPAQLVLQDVCTLQGSQFKDASLIVASPPCQEYSYMAMPWSRAKARAAEYRSGIRDVQALNRLFNQCERLQREASQAAGHPIPLVIENVRGAQDWVGRSRWSYGSFHLWGDVPALMPMSKYIAKRPGHNGEDSLVVNPAIKNTGGSWFLPPEGRKCAVRNNPDGRKVTGHLNPRDGHRSTAHLTNPAENGTKCGGDWFNADQPSISRMTSSKSTATKRASALIAKIPLTLSRHIGRVYYPKESDRGHHCA